MAFSKARRLSDLVSSAGEVSSFVDASVTHADLHTSMDLTGKTVTVANASTGDSDTTAANTAFVQQEIAALVDSAPGTLNTLNELAAALGDDASFSTTVTNSIATKLPLAGGTLTGALVVNTAGNGLPSVSLSHSNANADNFLITAGTPGTSNAGFSIRDVDAAVNRLVIDTSGNVGIGTSGYNVHSGTGLVVHATTGGTGNTGSPRIRLTNTTTGQAATDGAELSLDGNTKNFYIENRESEDIIFYSGSERMRIHSSGNVGIGTNNPAQKLHVSGGSGASTAVKFGEAYDTSVYIKATNTASGMLRFQNAADTTVYAAGFRNDSGDGTFRIRKAATLDSGGHRWDFDAAGALSIVPSNAAATLNITASASGNDSAVHMATALNARGFYVDDSAVNRMKFYSGYGKGAANREIIMNNDGDLAIGAGRKFYLDGEGDTYIMEYAGNELGFYTGGGQRVKISGGHLYSNGNVYSGTTSTSAAYTLNSQTTHGNWGVGCHNASYAHFTTDRGIYYFNTQCQASGGFHTYSDERLKEEISPLTGALDDVAKMNGVTFKWKDAEKRGGNSTSKQFGVIAQNMLEVDSELPQLNNDPLSPEETIETDDSYYSMDYSRLTPYFIEAIKELKTKLETAEARIKVLEG